MTTAAGNTPTGPDEQQVAQAASLDYAVRRIAEPLFEVAVKQIETASTEVQGEFEARLGDAEESLERIGRQCSASEKIVLKRIAAAETAVVQHVGDALAQTIDENQRTSAATGLQIEAAQHRLLQQLDGVQNAASNELELGIARLEARSEGDTATVQRHLDADREQILQQLRTVQEALHEQLAEARRADAARIGAGFAGTNTRVHESSEEIQRHLEAATSAVLAQLERDQGTATVQHDGAQQQNADRFRTLTILLSANIALMSAVLGLVIYLLVR